MDGDDTLADESLTLCSRCKNCPVITQRSDGSFLLTDPDRSPSLAIELDREQAALLATFLGVKLRAPRHAAPSRPLSVPPP